MALKITQWNLKKIILFIIDIIILIFNALLFFFISYIIYTEYYTRGTVSLFFTPLILSIINIFIDILMNKANYIRKYAGHNRYGMLTRFFMFDFVIIIVIYSDQRAKYILKDIIKTFGFVVIILGLIDVGFIIVSMVFSFLIIDEQSFKQMWVKKKKKIKTEMKLEPNGKLVENDN